MNDRLPSAAADTGRVDALPHGHASAASPWRAHLRLGYHRQGARTIGVHEHEGPLRVLKALYPEGDAVCHHVVIHPPGGIAGGDELAIDIDVSAGAHALLTTPGATRFYRSRGEPAVQRVRAHVQAGARLEWLPMETIAHDGAIAANDLHVRVGPGASMIGWDLACLGLPASACPFAHGVLTQLIDAEGLWLERARIEAGDMRLLRSPLGLAGRPVFGVAWLIVDERDTKIADVLDATRAMLADEPPVGVEAAVTCLAARLLVVRVLAWRVEPAMRMLHRARSVWRRRAWGLGEVAPRVWST